MLETITKSMGGVVANIAEKSIFWLYEAWVGQPVMYRDTIKLRHIETSRSLHSHDKKYKHPNSSGQQQVTAYNSSDSNDYWIIKGPDGQPEDYKAGQPVRHGDIIRLQHLKTKRNLHSHGSAPSPLTNQQEVTAFGENGIGDFNDNWRIEINRGRIWRENLRVRLIHVDTNHALHSHIGHAHPEYTENQQEVTGFKERDKNDWWRISR